MQILKIAGVLFITGTLAACSSGVARKGGDGNSGNGGFAGFGRSDVTVGSLGDFSVNIGDRVFFDTDSASITPRAAIKLQSQAKWLNNYPAYSITIEGHADERGTRAYNLALAARRAAAVKAYLSENGVGSSRMRTISYGKERPEKICSSPACWSENRRSVTVLDR
jgi:peptidoglycan-associated lipoprotein